MMQACLQQAERSAALVLQVSLEVERRPALAELVAPAEALLQPRVEQPAFPAQPERAGP